MRSNILNWLKSKSWYCIASNRYLIFCSSISMILSLLPRNSPQKVVAPKPPNRHPEYPNSPRKSQLSPNGSSATFVRPWVFVGIPGSNGVGGDGLLRHGGWKCLDPKMGALLYWSKVGGIRPWRQNSVPRTWTLLKSNAVLLKVSPKRWGKSFGNTSC